MKIEAVNEIEVEIAIKARKSGMSLL